MRRLESWRLGKIVGISSPWLAAILNGSEGEESQSAIVSGQVFSTVSEVLRLWMKRTR